MDREGPPSAAARLPHHAPRPAPRRTRSTPPTPPRTHALARTIRAAIGRDLIARGPDHHFDEMLKASSFPPAPAPRNHGRPWQQHDTQPPDDAAR